MSEALTDKQLAEIRKRAEAIFPHTWKAAVEVITQGHKDVQTLLDEVERLKAELISAREDGVRLKDECARAVETTEILADPEADEVR